MKKIRILADVGQRIQIESYIGVPLYSYQKICDIEVYEIREEETHEEKVECEE